MYCRRDYGATTDTQKPKPEHEIDQSSLDVSERRLIPHESCSARLASRTLRQLRDPPDLLFKGPPSRNFPSLSNNYLIIWLNKTQSTYDVFK
jgi:hypothetical protein